MIEKLGVTSIFVTHDQDEAIEVADEIIITNKGRIEQMGTPLEIYQNPQTPFAAGFFGQTSYLKDYRSFKTFDDIEGVESAIVRPEFVKVTKKDEFMKFRSSACEGVIERTAFRGDNIELTVSANGSTFTARRGLDEQSVKVGEKVDVFIYRLFVTVGDKAYLLENKSLNEDYVVI
jgi:sulfate transport system ATP-binding protein